MAFKIHDPNKLLLSLCDLPRETNWVEFKENRFNSESTGQYVSALANSAMLENKEMAYLVYGVEDGTHQIVGTTVDLAGESVGSESFVFWLNKYLEPHINVHPISFGHNGKRIEMLCIEPGYIQPVKFKSKAYIRIDANVQPLTNYPERERTLWQTTSSYSFENAIIRQHMKGPELLSRFDLDGLTKALSVRYDDANTIIKYVANRRFIRDNLQGGYEVSALLAISCAKDMNDFALVEGKGTRVITYKGKDKLTADDDIEGQRGYLTSFKALLRYVLGEIPSEEQMIQGVRTKVYDIPEDAIREFLANALIHQDFTVKGSRPVVEIYKDKVRFINPGTPLVDVERFIDTPSRTRNPHFAKLMREAGFCEERGVGVDRAIRAIERAALPPPLIQTVEGSTVVTAFMPRRFADMTGEERVRACFQHAALSYERGSPMSNGSLRARFALSDKQYPQVSAVIRDSIEAGKIRPLNEDQGNRNARYVPWYIM